MSNPASRLITENAEINDTILNRGKYKGNFF